MDINKVIKEFVEHDLVSTAPSGELAYLALTSKIEHQVRDRLASWIYKGKKNFPEIIPAREWKRRDLVLIENGSPKIFIEFKAWYSFDFIYDSKGLINRMKDDFDKMKETIKKDGLVGQDHEMYTLTLATHPHSKITNPRQYENIIKYIYDVNYCYEGKTKGVRKNWCDKVYNDEKDLEFDVKDRFEHYLDGHKTTYGRVFLGNAFNTDVSLLFWIYGPFKYTDEVALGVK